MAEYLDKVGFKAMWDNGDMQGASSEAAGVKGLVPKPYVGDSDKFLRGDGTWSEVEGDTTYATYAEVEAFLNS